MELLHTTAEHQVALFQSAALNETHLQPTYRRWVAWAAALASKDDAVVQLISRHIEPLQSDEQYALEHALNRMAVTNPYFFSRQFFAPNAGGSLEALAMPPFASLGIENDTAYHYACIAISMINGGYACYQSHMSSLLQAGETDAAIDQAMRLTAAVSALRQATFNARTLAPTS